MRHRHGNLIFAVERDVAGQHFKEHDAKRVEVRLPCDIVAESLLWAYIIGCSEHAPVGRK